MRPLYPSGWHHSVGLVASSEAAGQDGGGYLLFCFSSTRDRTQILTHVLQWATPPVPESFYPQPYTFSFLCPGQVNKALPALSPDSTSVYSFEPTTSHQYVMPVFFLGFPISETGLQQVVLVDLSLRIWLLTHRNLPTFASWEPGLKPWVTMPSTWGVFHCHVVFVSPISPPLLFI